MARQRPAESPAAGSTLTSGGQATGAAARPVDERPPVPLRPRFLRVDGLRIAYVDAGYGPAVLLVHGYAHSVHGWRKNIGPLTEAGYRVMAIDLPGFGHSDKPGHYSLESYATLLEHWLDLHCIDRATLVGNSLGGLIAGAVASRLPERVSALVLVDPAGFGRELSWVLRLANVLTLRGLLLPRHVGRWQIRRALRWVYADASRIEDEEVEHIIEGLRLPGARSAFVEIGRRSAGLRGLRPAMGMGELPDSITVPTLVLWGARDRLTPVEQAATVVARIPGAQLTVFPDCGHAPQMEVPELFNERVIRFLRRPEGAPD